MRIELYIEGQLIDLSDKIDYTLNKSFKDLLNPTDIKAEYSKTIEVPFTPRNNIIFGNIYRLDQQQYISPDQSIFQWFDPARKLRCELKYNQSTIFKGYAKMTTITNNTKKASYNLNLFGDAAFILSELKKMTINSDDIVDPNDPEQAKYLMTDYLGGVSKFTPEEILVDRNSIGKYFEKSEPTAKSGAFITNYNKIGFTYENMGLPDDFDCKSIYEPKSIRKGDARPYSTSDNVLQLKDIIVDNPDTDINAETADVLIGDGILPRALGEFRSYMTKPFVFVNQYFNHICKNLSDITGYNIDIDKTWANEKNPYWYNLVYMCKNLSSEAGDVYNNSYETRMDTLNIDKLNEQPATTQVGIPHFVTIREEGDADEGSLKNGFIFYTPKNRVTAITGSLNLAIRCAVKNQSQSVPAGNHISKYNAFIITVDYYKSDTANRVDEDMVSPAKSQRYFIISANSTIKPTIPEIKYIKATDTDANGRMYFKIPIDFGLVRYAHPSNAPYLYYKISWSIYDDSKDIMGSGVIGNKVYLSLINNPANISAQVRDNVRSNRIITFKDIMQGLTPYDFFMTYIKMFNLIVYTKDDTLYIQRYNTYFKDHKILDYSTKLDRTKDFTMTPVIFDSKYLKMNYGTPETYINKEYLKKTKFNYGELNLKTNYNFNDETKDLFDNLNCYIPISPNVLSWDELYLGTYRVSQIEETAGCYYKQDDNKQSPEDYDRCFAFWRRRGKWDPKFRKVYITDDSEYEVIQDKYMYHLIDSQGTQNPYNKWLSNVPSGYNEITNNIIVRRSVQPTQFDRQYYISFTEPKYDYTSSNKNYYLRPELHRDIYTCQFKNYYNEIYNLNNYKLECYLYLSNLDYYNFKHNQFVTIDNQLFFINKIMDFNPVDSESTKCELIKVTDINNYLNAQETIE